MTTRSAPRLRGTRPDVDDPERGYWLLKNVSRLHLTYQIKLLGYLATKNDRYLFIKVPKTCELSPTLESWAKGLVTDDGHQRVQIQRC